MSLGQGREQDPSQNQNRSLDQCPDCEGKFLQDREGLEEAASGIWFAYLQCADCGHEETRALSNDQADELNGVLDDRALELKAELEQMERLKPEEMIGAIAASTVIR